MPPAVGFENPIPESESSLDRAAAGIGQEDRWMDTHQLEASIVPMIIAVVLLQTCALTDVSTLLKGRD